MTGKATKTRAAPRARRWGVDLAILVAIGLLMSFLGPFGSDRVPDVDRYIYWMICMVGGGLIGIAGDDLLGSRFTSAWRGVAAVALAMAAPVGLLVGRSGGVGYLYFIGRGNELPAIPQASRGFHGH